MLEYHVSQRVHYPHMVLELCKHVKTNDISKRRLLLLSRVIFLSLISYNVGLFVGSQRKKRQLQSLELLNHHRLSCVFSKQASSLAANPWFSYTCNSRRLCFHKYHLFFIWNIGLGSWYCWSFPIDRKRKEGVSISGILNMGWCGLELHKINYTSQLRIQFGCVLYEL